MLRNFQYPVHEYKGALTYAQKAGVLMRVHEEVQDAKDQLCWQDFKGSK